MKLPLFPKLSAWAGLALVTLGVAPAGAQSARPADFIVAVVNSEPITNNEVRIQANQFLAQMAQARQPRPPNDEVARLALERLINERAQVQVGKDSGIRVDNQAVDQAELAIAQRNGVDVPTLHRRLAADGVGLSQFRESLRDQIVLQRVREREVEARVRVTDLEVAQYLRDQQSGPPAAAELALGHILVAVPEGASAEQVAALQTKAQGILTRVRAGGDFAALARELSDAGDRGNGGNMGLRPAERYPSLFVEATRDLPVGGVAELKKSDAGFHILKLLDKGAAGGIAASVPQTRARHILLRSSPQLNETQARAKLVDVRSRVVNGQADFAALARDISQDGSAPEGGDLGWAVPGQFVPEFEQVMNALAPGQISEPFVSRFGMHLIQVTERRVAKLSQREIEEVARGQLREKKAEEQFLVWAQEVRGRAYVEMREAPRL
ncbi:MAG: hypothetical protein RLZZ126_1100 [Pseudomonadota bacterium]|jgi:peptidyl-prolyl cis-trans isomerase SurA